MKHTGIAEIETNKDDEQSFIIIKIGPFKDRRSAQRKLTDFINKTDKNKP